MHSIELLFDDETDAAVRAEWRALAECDLPSLERHTGATNRPHVTMLVADSLDTADLAPLREAVGTLPLTVSLGGVVIFGAGRRGFVLARHIIVTRELAALHRSIHSAALGLAEGVVDLTLPDHWTPHVTLARRLTAPQIGAALEAIGAAALPPGIASAARIWDGLEKTVTPLT
ncbi:2'-5' RNA ligase family protein [Planctomonas psychrotolerans]|uniref:2'-5' RNA ligase family protein n=1 Tax=Planctomonas psychrotolerans TaxID=2528712 RepID=UPI0012394EB4|nr:2'-5' RNA ligase family protein [Planctomonas psychrotolerans]